MNISLKRSEICFYDAFPFASYYRIRLTNCISWLINVKLLIASVKFRNDGTDGKSKIERRNFWSNLDILLVKSIALIFKVFT